MVPFLKFLAIFVSAASGALGLLVDFKKDGKVTKPGFIALVGIIVSFLIAAILQGFELDSNKKAAIAEQQKTKAILDSINRGVYNIDAPNISFDVSARIHYNQPLFEKYNARLRAAFLKYKDNNNPLPEGTDRFLNENDKGQKNLVGFTIRPESPLFPDIKKEPLIYQLIGESMLDISIYKSDNLKSFQDTLSQDANLFFNTERAKTKLTYWFNDSTIDIQAGGMHPRMESYAWRNHGSIESLLDLPNGIVSFTMNANQDFDEATQHILKSIEVRMFSFNVRSRKFSSGSLCRRPVRYPEYYLKLPASMLETHLNIQCTK